MLSSRAVALLRREGPPTLCEGDEGHGADRGHHDRPQGDLGVYGARKIHTELNRQGVPVARCTRRGCSPTTRRRTGPCSISEALGYEPIGYEGARKKVLGVFNPIELRSSGTAIA